MRTIFFSCLLALGIAAVIWLQHSPTGSTDGTETHSADTQARPEVAAASKLQARRASSNAGITLRSTNILATAARQPNASAATNALEKKSMGDAPTMRASTREETSARPKSAAELFTPFVEDDPSLVFPPSTVQYHSALQSETPDPDWGPSTAAALRNSITSQYGDRFDIPLVECRRDLCELQVAGRIGGDSAADMGELQRMIQRMKQSQLWSSLQLDQETSLVSTSPDGRALWLSFISRL